MNINGEKNLFSGYYLGYFYMKMPPAIAQEAFCGETEIRTRDTLLEYTRFPGVPLKPLEHLSRLKSRKTGLQI